MTQPNEQSFLKDVEKHEMRVLLQAGPYRHLLFVQPDTGNMWFEIITWPNKLTIAGDMGTWVFSRVEDMFNFFRSPKLRIKPDYWGEKLQNGVFGGSSEAKKFDADAFKEEVLDSLTNWDLTPEQVQSVAQQLEDEVFQSSDDSDSQHEQYRSLYAFSCDEGVKWDCEIPDGMVYRYHYIWCLYAIVWGIQQWDAKEQGTAAGGVIRPSP